MRTAPRAATSGCFTSSDCASRTASTPACSQHRFGAEVRRLWGDYDYASEVHVAARLSVSGVAGIRHGARRRAVAARLRVLGLLGHASAARTSAGPLQGGVRIDTQTYDGSDDGEQWSPRIGVLYTLSPQTQLRASWRPLRPVPGHQRAAGRGRRRHVLPGAARRSLDPRRGSCVRRRPRPASRSVPQGLPAHQSALREHLRSARAVARSGVRPRADRTGRRPRDRRGNDAAAAAARLVERLAELQLVARGGSHRTAWTCRAAGISATP